MNQAIRELIKEMMEEAREIAFKAMMQPRAEREYMILCGRHQQLIADSKRLKERFLDPEQRAEHAEAELPDDLDTDVDFDPPPPQPQRRVRPQPDRLAQQRARHTPRSV